MESLDRRMRRRFSKISSREVFGRSLDQVIGVPLYRNALYLIAGSFITAAFGFFFWMIVARLYSVTEVGLGSAIVSAVNLVALLASLGLNFSVIRFLSRAPSARGLVNTCLTVSGLVSLALAAIFVAGATTWSPQLRFIRGDPIFFTTFLAMAALTTLSTLLNSVFLARRRAVFVLYKDALTALLKIALVAGFAVFLHTFGVVASWTLALAIAFALSIMLFLPGIEKGYRPVPTLNMGQLRDISRYSLGSYVAALLQRAPLLVLPLMVLYLLGTESNAYFYVAWMLANMLSAMTRSISQSLFAEGSYAREDMGQSLTRSLRMTMMLVVPAMVLLFAAGKWILLAFGTGYSSSALGLLWLLSVASLPRGFIHVYTGLLRAQDRLGELLAIRSFIFVAVPALCWLAAPEYGIIGVGYVWLGVQVLVAIVIAPRMARETGRSPDTSGGGSEDVDTL